MSRSLTFKLAALGIVAVTILEAAAIIKELDGAFFGPAVAAISGIVGFFIGKGRPNVR